MTFTGCEFTTHSGVFLAAATGVTFRDCTFIGVHDCNTLLSM